MQNTANGMALPSAAAGAVSDSFDGSALGWRGARAWRLLLIDRRDLIRGCLEYWLNASARVFKVISVASAEAVLANGTLDEIDLAVVSVDASPRAGAWFEGQVGMLRSRRLDLPVVVLGDAEGRGPADDVARRSAVHGYLTTSTNMDVAVAALHLIAAGGSYIPAGVDSFSGSQSHMSLPQSRTDGSQLTPREMAVLDLLEAGLANKNIAFELSMSESTVKVHVRNIMKKLHARNRTEAAVIGRSSQKARGDMVVAGHAPRELGIHAKSAKMPRAAR